MNTNLFAYVTITSIHACVCVYVCICLVSIILLFDIIFQIVSMVSVRMFWMSNKEENNKQNNNTKKHKWA